MCTRDADASVSQPVMQAADDKADARDEGRIDSRLLACSAACAPDRIGDHGWTEEGAALTGEGQRVRGATGVVGERHANGTAATAVEAFRRNSSQRRSEREARDGVRARQQKESKRRARNSRQGILLHSTSPPSPFLPSFLPPSLLREKERGPTRSSPRALIHLPLILFLPFLSLSLSLSLSLTRCRSSLVGRTRGQRKEGERDESQIRRRRWSEQMMRDDGIASSHTTPITRRRETRSSSTRMTA